LFYIQHVIVTRQLLTAPKTTAFTLLSCQESGKFMA